MVTGFLIGLLLGGAAAATVLAVWKKRRPGRRDTRYRSLVENAKDIVYSLTPAGAFDFVSPSWTENLGHRPDEVVGRDPEEFIHPDDRILYRGFLDRIRRTGEKETSPEFRLRHLDGRWVWFTSAVSVERTVDGEIAAYLAIAHDVTGAKRMAEAVEESEKRRADIINFLPDPTFVIDGDGRVVAWNRAMEDLTGIRAEEMLGMGNHEYALPLYGRRRPLLIDMVLGGDESRNGEDFEPIETDGGLAAESFHPDLGPNGLYLAGVAVPLYDARGRAVGAIQSLRDITESKRLARELTGAKEAAQAANQAKSDFLATMSHEIRTPLGGVVGMTDMLLDTQLTEEQRGFAETVQKSADILLAVINDVLDFSKIEAGRLDLESVVFDLRSAVEDVGRLMALGAQQKGLELVVRYAPRSPRTFVGDPGRIRQILTNLVGNAVKFTAEGHVLVDVRAKAADGNRADVSLRVEDTGVGIPAEALETVFEKFTQADASVSRRFGGTGLGLTICRRLVELMGGRIEAASEPGGGAEFRVSLTLPLAGEYKPETEATPETPGRRALVADDHPEARRVLAEQLESLGLRAGAVSSGREALDELRRAAEDDEPYQIALLDDRLPDAAGDALAAAIAADGRLSGLAVIALTPAGRSGASSREAEGVAAALEKPVAASRLPVALAAVRATHDTRGAEPVGPRPESRLRFQARVLLVEDNPTNQTVSMTVLGKLGCRVDLAANGREAVELAAGNRYDMVFMDCQMPVMDGFEAARLIREGEGAGRRTPIVAMTAHATGEARDGCLAADMDDFVSKPVRRETLARILTTWVGPGREETAPAVSKVLVVDDDPAAVRNIVSAVRRAYPEAAVRTASGGVEACTLVGSFLPDVLIADIMMPDMDGLELIRFLGRNARYAGVRIVMVTALSPDDPRLAEALALGAVGGLTKPVGPEDLTAAIEGKPEDDEPAEVVELTADGPDELILDTGIIQATFDDDVDSIREFLAIYLTDVPDQIADLEDAVAAGDLNRIERAAHLIKGGAAEVGGLRLQRAAWEIEAAAREGDGEACRRILPAVRGEFETLGRTLAGTDWKTLT